MAEQYNWIIPEVEMLGYVAESIAAHQVAYDFYHEVRYREQWQQYVQWYRSTAEQHQQDLKAMRQEPNLMRWFGRSPL